MVKTISKNTINTIRQLHSAKQRHESGLFIAEGDKIVRELLRSDFKVRLVACLPEYHEDNKALLADFDVNLVNEIEFSRISLLQTPNQILALVETPPEVQPVFDSAGIYLILDGIRDPGNLGTMIRTAEWFGVKGIICSNDCVDVFNPKVVQATMGSVFRVPVFYGSLPDIIEKFKVSSTGIVIGAVLGGIPFREVQVQYKSVMLVIGSEANGISDEVKPLLDHKISIIGAPAAETESLNAAVACGILLNELNHK